MKFKIKSAFLFSLIFISASSRDKYSDLKNRGLKGSVKSIEQKFYNNLQFEDNIWAVDSSKLYMKTKIIFDASGNIGIYIKEIKTSEGWQKLEYIYDYEKNIPKGYFCQNDQGKDIENCKFSFITDYLLESNIRYLNFEFVNETMYLNKEFRAYKTIRRHFKKDKLESEELVKDEYNDKNEIMKTSYTNTYYIHPKRSNSSELSNTYQLYKKDHISNWTEMAVMINEEDRLFYYTTREIEYYK